MFQNKNPKRYFLFALLLCLLPIHAWADVGVPMILVTMPAMLIGLLPVIGIEAYIIKLPLNLTKKRALICSACANAVSTLIGIPLTWIALTTLELITGGGKVHGLDTFFQKFMAVTWQAPWLVPYEEDLKWMIPTAMLVLLIPFFFASWYSEYFVIRFMNKHIEPKVVKAACFKANLVTYILLGLYPASLYLL